MIWPWRKRDKVDSGEAEAARERAEKALRDVRRRRAEMEGLGRWFRVDAEQNHYGQGAERLFLGRDR